MLKLLQKLFSQLSQKIFRGGSLVFKAIPRVLRRFCLGIPASVSFPRRRESRSGFIFACVLLSVILLSPQHSSALTAVSTSDTALVRNGLVGYWTFDGKNMTNTTATDLSGNGNSGVLTNMTQAGNALIGKIGQALNLKSANSSYIAVPQNGKFNVSGTAFTVSLWVKEDTSYAGLGVFHRIISWYDGSKNIQVGLAGADVTPAGTRQFYVFNDSASASSKVISSIPGGVSLGWHHVLAMFDGTTYTLYVDGVSSSGGAAGLLTGVFTGNSSTLYIGQRGDGGSTYSNGSIDEVRIYNRAITTKEIQALYKAGGGVTQASTANTKANTNGTGISGGLVGHWTFDGKNMTNATATDISGSGYNGLLINMTASSSVVAGKIGQGIKLDGINDYVDAGSASLLDDIPVVTLTAWIKPTTSGGGNYGRIFDKGGGVGGLAFYTCGDTLVRGAKLG